ncbi:MAG: ATP-dependent RecD-like DNA helicase [Nitrospirota bacterium]|nr:ATP-dependent RecD-like DNA helicase [Nitrospirota bacterium]
MPTELEGQIERITYCNEENHFTIAKLKVNGRKNPVTIIGNLFSVAPGEILKLNGSWNFHPKYGEQFRIISYETETPATEKGIERYLGSGLIKGIGPVMAKRLVAKFRDGTLNIIESDINRLKEVEGIGDKRIVMIKTAWDEQKDIRNVMLFLQSHEVSSGYAVKIFKQYGKDSIKVVKENPYRLAADIFGIGFQIADRISEKLGIPKDSPLRAEAGILYVLRQFADEGHVCYPHEPLIEECRRILEIETGIIVTAMEKLLSKKKIVVDGQYAYLVEFHISETGIADNLRRIFDVPENIRQFQTGKAIEWAEKNLGITLAGNQIKAIEDSVDKKIMVITGGPGTGKTTIINAIIKIYRQLGHEVMLAAPTGRAAKRMCESTGHEAKTIHRLLEFSPRQGGFKKNAENRLDADLLIIDEASMVDTMLMHHLLQAVKSGSTLILVGDADQLPSVGAGNVLQDIINSGYIPTVKLNEIFRQSRESLIIVNAHRINRGESPVIITDRDSPRDFYFVQVEEPEKVSGMIVKMCKESIPGKFGWDPVNDIQVLTPMHKGIVGTSNLNAELQKHLNPSKEELSSGGKIFRVGDKVMQIRNNYDRNIYNGDIGRITAINREDREVTIDYDGKASVYDFTELDEVVLAYAISVHKSQGSEYSAVVMPLLTQHYMMLQRNLLYTAITRGKKLVVIIGTKKALAIAVKNDKPRKRHSNLAERLKTP